LGEWYLKASAAEAPDIPDNAYYDGAQTDVAIKKLTELKDKDRPFFFAVGYYRPHLPFNAPKKYWDMYNRDDIPLAENGFVPEDSPPMAINNMRELRGYTDFKHALHPNDVKLSEDEDRLLKHGYLASVSYIDAQIGRLLETLDKLKLRENTIIVLWGDHGWKLGEHNSWAKMTNFEIDARVPLIISTPETRSKNIKTNALVEFVDIYPSLCELAELPIPENLEGISAVPLISQPEKSWKKAVFTQFLREGIWIAPDGVEYMGMSMRTERYRYVEWLNWETKELKAIELYDHDNDPQENVNIANLPENKELVLQLAEKMKKGWQESLP
jgi:arylsulfatase A-like enzyme